MGGTGPLASLPSGKVSDAHAADLCGSCHESGSSGLPAPELLLRTDGTAPPPATPPRAHSASPRASPPPSQPTHLASPRRLSPRLATPTPPPLVAATSSTHGSTGGGGGGGGNGESHNALEIVFLNACDSAKLGAAIISGLPSRDLCVVCWSTVTEDTAARAFAQGFADELGQALQAELYNGPARRCEWRGRR